MNTWFAIPMLLSGGLFAGGVVSIAWERIPALMLQAAQATLDGPGTAYERLERFLLRERDVLADVPQRARLGDRARDNRVLYRFLFQRAGDQRLQHCHRMFFGLAVG